MALFIRVEVAGVQEGEPPATQRAALELQQTVTILDIAPSMADVSVVPFLTPTLVLS